MTVKQLIENINVTFVAHILDDLELNVNLPSGINVKSINLIHYTEGDYTYSNDVVKNINLNELTVEDLTFLDKHLDTIKYER